MYVCMFFSKLGIQEICWTSVPGRCKERPCRFANHTTEPVTCLSCSGTLPLPPSPPSPPLHPIHVTEGAGEGANREYEGTGFKEKGKREER